MHFNDWWITNRVMIFQNHVSSILVKVIYVNGDLHTINS